MLLPSKAQIQNAKSKERQLDIDQGLSFARKVDVIRATKEKEEKELNDFRSISMAALKKDIEEAMKKKDSLIAGVKTLEERKAEALKPLTEESDKLEAKREEIKQSEDKVNKLVISLSAKERDLSIKQEQAHSFLKQVESSLKDAKDKQIEATNDRQESSTTLKTARLNKERIDLEISLKSKELTQRETIAANKEKDNRIKEENNRIWEKQLYDKERAINDKYETLLRTIKRTNG